MQRQSTEGKVLVMAGAIPGVAGSDRVYLSDDVGNLLLAPFYDAAEIILGRLLTGANMRKGRQCIYGAERSPDRPRRADGTLRAGYDGDATLGYGAAECAFRKLPCGYV